MADQRNVFIFENDSLLIRNVSLVHAGRYFCQATNKLSLISRSSKKAHVQIYGNMNLYFPSFLKV